MEEEGVAALGFVVEWWAQGFHFQTLQTKVEEVVGLLPRGEVAVPQALSWRRSLLQPQEASCWT